MFNTKRKRAVVLALIAFFCTAATTYVAVDWKRFGGGFLAFLKGGKGDPVVASASGSGSRADRSPVIENNHPATDTPPHLAAAGSRKHTSATGGANGNKSEDDLFKYGNPAAGGIPPGNFIVAQNDTSGGGEAPPPVGAPVAPETSGSPAPGGAGGGDVSAPAPAPGGGNGGPIDTGLGGTAPTPPAPPTDSPPSPPPSSLPPVSPVPESSSLAMMSLGALFLAVAAARRKQG